MKIEIWSDFACPFCYIGKRHFEMAMQQFEATVDIEVVYRSFELDPNARPHPGMNMHGLLAEKYGMSIEQAKSMNARVARQAAAVGLTYQFDKMIPTNSFDAHRLTHFADMQGKMGEMVERLFKAFFIDAQDIGDRETLANLAAEVGLSKAEALRVLERDDHCDAVRQDEQEAMTLGIHGVPFFVIDRKYAISGAQPIEVFVDTLNEVSVEGRTLSFVDEPNTDSMGTEIANCEDDTCHVPTDKQ